MRVEDFQKMAEKRRSIGTLDLPNVEEPFVTDWFGSNILRATARYSDLTRRQFRNLRALNEGFASVPLERRAAHLTADYVDRIYAEKIREETFGFLNGPTIEFGIRFDVVSGMYLACNWFRLARSVEAGYFDDAFNENLELYHDVYSAKEAVELYLKTRSLAQTILSLLEVNPTGEKVFETFAQKITTEDIPFLLPSQSRKMVLSGGNIAKGVYLDNYPAAQDVVNFG